MVSARTECLDDEEVAALIATELAATERAVIERHLDGCATCRAIVATASRSMTHVEPTGPACVGRYRVGERIGRGGMGEVFRATPIDPPGPDIALKLLQRADARALLHFKQEFRTVADVCHRNLVALYELGCDRDEWYIAMEIVDGVDFVSAVRGDHDRLRRALRELAEGLSVLHAAGHVHRDIKPGNVMVERGGRVIILDFGLVSALSAHAGTPAYMAPEVVAGSSPTAAADFYAVGVMLHEVLAGTRTVGITTPTGPDDLVRLCRALLEPDPRKRAGAAELAALADGLAVPLAGRRDLAQFVGRDDELAVLSALLDEVRAGEGRVVAVSGPSGIGKSTLVRRFLESAGNSVIALCGRCYDRETVAHKAIDPLVDELARVLLGLSEADRAALRPTDAKDLVRMFPVLRACFSDDSASPIDLVDLPLAHRRATRALRSLLAALAARGPLILWIDDLQWGDADSAPILAELLAPPAPALLLVATHRPGEVPPLGTLARRTLELAPLEGEEATVLAAQIGPHDRVRAEQIAHESGGNPLFIVELARDDLPASSSLDRVIQARFVSLPDVAKGLLAAIVVAARPIDHALVTRVADASQAPLARLRADRWVEVRGLDVESVHDRVRIAVRDALASEEIVMWHGRLARALEDAGADPELLAEHWRGAANPARAQAFAIVAADNAMRALSFDRAARLYELAASLTFLDPPRAAAIAASRARAFAAAGRHTLAARMFDLARSHTTGDAAAEYARLGAEELVRSGELDSGLGVLDEVLGTMGVRLRGNPRGAARSLVLRRFQLWFELERRPRSRATTNDRVLRRIDTCWAVASTLGTVDTLRAAELHCRTLIDALRAGEPNRVARSLAAEAAFAAATGPRARRRVDGLLARARAITNDDRDPLLAGTLAGATGMAAFLTGRWLEAVDAFEQSEALLARSAAGAWERGTARLYTLISLAYLGRIRELRRRIADELVDADDRGDRYASTSMRTAACNIAWLAGGDANVAREMAANAERMWSRRGFHLQHAWSLLSRARADLYAGDGERAFAQLAESWPALEASLLLRIQIVAIEALDLRARSALASARRGVRSARLEQAARDARTLASFDGTHARALAKVLEANLRRHEFGDVAGARRHLTTAMAEFSACSMALHARATERAVAMLDGDDARIARVDGWMRAEDIADPRAMSALLVP
jgi:serine/threonine protein kinase